MADWYYTCDGKQMEPVTASELRQLATSGFLQPTDMVWKEGMANWVKASALKDLFPPGVSSAAVVASRSPAVAPAPVPDTPAEEEPAPRRRRRRDDGEEDVEREDRPRRRRREKASSGNGLIIGLIIGGGVFVLLIVGVILAFALRGSRGPLGAVNYTLNLNPSNFQSRTFEFKANTQYEIRVTSSRFTDVDLHVKTPVGGILAMDESIGPNSLLRWTPPNAGSFVIEVRNLDRVQRNTATVNIRELGPGVPIAGPVAPINPVVPIIKPGPGNNLKVGGPTRTDALPALNPGGNWQTNVTYAVAKPVEVRVTSNAPPGCDVDLFVQTVDGRHVGNDVTLSANCRVSFMASPNTTYQFRVMNLGPGIAHSTITYTAP